MSELTTGASVTLTAPTRGTVFTVAWDGGTLAAVSGAQTASLGPTPGRRGFGPLDYGQSVTITCQTGRVVYEYGDATPSDTGTGQFFSTSEMTALQAMVTGDGIERLRRSALRPANQAVTMSSPPTITVGTADAATTISGGVDIAWDSALLTYQTAVTTVSANWPDTTLARPAYLDTSAEGSNVSLVGLMTGFTFETSATVFEVRAKGYSSHRVWVIEDDNIPRALAVQTMASTGNVYRVKYDFGGSRVMRRIYVQFDRAIGGICVGPTEAVTKWSPNAPRLAIVGDSITEGTGASALTGYAQRLAERLGCFTSLINCGIGGTGYVANTSGTKKNARSIVDSSVIPSAPDVVIWAHGLNDSSSDVSVNAAYCFDAVRAALPNVPQIVFMPFQPRSITGIASTRTQLLTVAAARPWLTVIDLTTYGSNPEVTGTGRVGATTGSGNSDWWTGSDTTHPTVDGHIHSAQVRDAAIRTALRLC